VRKSERENSPTPEQMFELAGLCFDLGRIGRNGRRTLTLGTQPFRAMNFRSDYVSPPDQTYYDFIFDDPLSVSRRFVGRVALERFKAWHMEIREVSALYKGGEMVDRVQIIDRFNWNGSKVGQAMRKIFYSNFEKVYESYEAPSLDGAIFQPDLVHGFNQVSRLTAADCDGLIDNLVEFTEELERV